MDTDVCAEAPCWLPRCNGLRDEVTIAKHFLPPRAGGVLAPSSPLPAVRSPAGSWSRASCFAMPFARLV